MLLYLGEGNSKIHLATLSRKIIAWGIHIFTSSGILAAFMAMVAINNGHWHHSFMWLLLCFVIDSLDGTLARKFDVGIVLPGMDGKSIDFVIDFASYALIPTYFFYRANMTSSPLMPVAIGIMLISSCLYYGKKEMVVDEQYFVGFPVLWNIVVFFQFFIFENQPLLNFISVCIIGILHFVPLKFAYPSRSKRFFIAHFLVSLIGFGATLFVLISYPGKQVIAQVLTVLCGAYFIVYAVYDTFYSAKKQEL